MPSACIGSKLGTAAFEAMKDIPKYIPAVVHIHCDRNATSQTDYVSKLEILKTAEGEEICERIFAFKKTKKGVLIKEVIRRCPSTVGGGNDSSKQIKPMILQCDMYYNPYSGWNVIFARKTSVYYGTIEPNGEFYLEYDSPSFGGYILNREEITKVEAYKYYTGNHPYSLDLMKELRLFREFSSSEFLLKTKLPLCEKIARKCEKDSTFRKWLVKNADKARLHSATAIISAYNRKLDIAEVQHVMDAKKELARVFEYHKPLYKRLDSDKAIKYLKNMDISYYPYKDYIVAANYCKWDMTHDRILYPRDFEEMHDKAIEEKAHLEKLARAKAEAEQRKIEAERKRKLAEMRANLSEKLLTMQGLTFDNGIYVAVIPTCFEDFVKEGNNNHNCVGRMDYDKKMYEGKCIIGFIRKINSPNTSFVTVELDGSANNIRQCYAEHNSKAPDDVKSFCEEWAKHCRKELKKIHQISQVLEEAAV